MGFFWDQDLVLVFVEGSSKANVQHYSGDQP